jgi:hypothetical protein
LKIFSGSRGAQVHFAVTQAPRVPDQTLADSSSGVADTILPFTPTFVYISEKEKRFADE